MTEELEKKLKEYADKRVDEVFDIDIGELRALVKDGAKWLYNELKDKLCKCGGVCECIK